MYILDTNVISEMRRPSKMDPGVASWAKGVQSSELFLSSISILELETGALLLSRRDRSQGKLILRWIEEQVLEAFCDRILPVDTDVARRCAALQVPDPRSYRDSLIAATAIVHKMTVVTRNVLDFEPMLPQVLNPWQT